MSSSTIKEPAASALQRRESQGKTKTVCVQGLGFVGAANAIAIASARDPEGRPLYRVIGVELANDLGKERAAALCAGRFPFATTDPVLKRAAATSRETGNLSAVTDNAIFGEADIIVVDVGLDIDEKGERPTFNLPPFSSAIAAVGDHMRSDALVLLESTVPPGTCERIVAPLLRERLQNRGLSGEDLQLAYCYERVMPGDAYLASIVDMWRVYAGLTRESADAAEVFLSSFVDTARRPLRRLASPRSAEMAKVLENTYRAVNIALIDEWERFARRADIDLFEVLEAIRVRPTHNNIRYPGLGVGGYCLSKDPMFGAASAREIFGFDDLQFPLSIASTQINDAMPLVSAEAMDKALPGGLKGKRVLVLGASYRQDVGDTRTSPSVVLATALLQRGAVVELTDPLVDVFEEAETPFHKDLPAAHGYDVIVFAVAHREFKNLDVLHWLGNGRPMIFDSNGVLSSETLAKLQKAGLKLGAIGRGAFA